MPSGSVDAFEGFHRRFTAEVIIDPFAFAVSSPSLRTR